MLPSRRIMPCLLSGVSALLLVATLAGCGLLPTSSSSSSSSSGAGAPARASVAAAHHAALTYVAIGASDAFGIGTDDPDRENWPTVAASSLGVPVHLVNLGIPEATAAQAEQAELPVALDQHPDIVTVWLAVNDLADGVPLTTYDQQLRALLHALRQGTRARIFVGNVPDLTLLPHFAGYDPTALTAEIQQWNAAIAADCAAEGAYLVDLYSGWSQLAQHPEYIAPDGFHPSTIGALVLGQIFADAIRQSPPA
jgi:lysophospholipase L1-like esterase